MPKKVEGGKSLKEHIHSRLIMITIKTPYSHDDLVLRVLELLEENNMNQAEFARCLNVDKSLITHIKSGSHKFTFATLDQACRVLGTTPTYLMYGVKSQKYANYK